MPSKGKVIEQNREQDWTTVVFKKKSPKIQHHIDPEVKKFRQLDDNTEDAKLKLDTISDDIKKTIILLRNQKKLNQKQLANSLNLKEDIIRSIEDESHPKNNILFNKIIQYLEKLPNPINNN